MNEAAWAISRTMKETKMKLRMSDSKSITILACCFPLVLPR